MNGTEGGIRGLPELAWGAYFCHFYASADELLDTVLPFFAAGLRGNEACLWLTNGPLSADDARAALRPTVPDFEDRERRGQIEIVDLEEWYHRAGPIDATDAWLRRAELAVQHGYAGLRLSSNLIEHVSSDPPIGTSFDKQRIIGLFSYSLACLSSTDVLDIASRYPFVLARPSAEDKDGSAPSAVQTVCLERKSGVELAAASGQREADRRKAELLGLLGHEIRSPLASILTASQLMSLRGAEQQYQKELAIIQRQVSRITTMLDELLDASRIVAGRIELNYQSLEIAEAIERGIQIATPLVAKRAHRLHVSCPPQGLTVHGDPTRLAQVVANLLDNAARSTETGCDITIRASRNGDRIAVLVTDTGPGIDAQHLATIFEPFAQGRGVRPSGNGLGLGLSIVRSLVELHGGTVEASSSIGHGSEFLVNLPALGFAPSVMH